MYCIPLSLTSLLGVGYIGGFSSLKFPTMSRVVGNIPFFDSEGLTNTSWIVLAIYIRLNSLLASTYLSEPNFKL